MPFSIRRGIRYYTFASFEAAGIPHAIFTRQGGISRPPWDTLNLGGTVGDDPVCVQENRRRAFAALDRPFESLYDVWQVHSDVVVCTDQPRPPEQEHLQADAIVTDRPEVTLFMRFADCTPILLYDPVRKVAGLAHAGWKGTVLHIAARTVERMQARYGCRPQDVLAGIGPSIGAHHYAVGAEVAGAVNASFGAAAVDFLLPGEQGGVHFDLWQANRWLLEQAGVRQIELSGLCTACTLQDWYSHRAEKGHTGRFGALIGIIMPDNV